MDRGEKVMESNDKINVVLADRDEVYMKMLTRCLEKEQSLHVVGMANSGGQVLQMIRDLKPDVLLMDVFLEEKDGLWVLEAMKENELRVNACIMDSVIGSDRIVQKAMSLGADYYMAKPVQGDVLMDRICQLVQMGRGNTEEVEGFTVEEREQVIPIFAYDNLETDVSGLLSRMGISASIKGYHYIRKAVMMAVEDEEVLIGITKGMYPDIAKCYKTTASKVERAVRHAIESSWKKGGKDVYFEFSEYYAKDKPTNGQFIAAMSEYFRLHHKKGKKNSA